MKYAFRKSAALSRNCLHAAKLHMMFSPQHHMSGCRFAFFHNFRTDHTLPSVVSSLARELYHPFSDVHFDLFRSIEYEVDSIVQRFLQSISFEQNSCLEIHPFTPLLGARFIQALLDRRIAVLVFQASSCQLFANMFVRTLFNGNALGNESGSFSVGRIDTSSAWRSAPSSISRHDQIDSSPSLSGSSEDFLQF